ncbi:hypothetical protein LCGC14_2398410 [marine sediment metagenome]|uniref:Uncharacterized protein n=1 Tax=marine sediment metagenome TaxID=412755 RepID=A0A0F9BW64_9ZZZZ
MPDIYSVAWKMLERKIASTRRQSISKVDLMKWQLEALEEAVDRAALEMLYAEMERRSGEQKEA